MNIINWIIIFLAAIILIKIISYIYHNFNLFTSLQVLVDEKAGNLNAALQRKFDMLPALLLAAQRYVNHEGSTFKEVTELRSRWNKSEDQGEKMESAGLLDNVLSRLLVLQEQYPQLKANENYINLQEGISLVESEVLLQRENYNNSVKEYNTKIRLFPKNIVSGLFAFSERPFFSGKQKQKMEE